jgi:secretion/DNA translocation related TadE-like protein
VTAGGRRRDSRWSAGVPVGHGGERTGPDGVPGARCRGERGSASLWVLACGLAVLLLGLGGAQVGNAMISRHRASSAADLAALAGARATYAGAATSCAQAGRLAAANHGRLVGCVVDGRYVTVTVEVDLAGPAGLALTARAVARAGPVGESP